VRARQIDREHGGQRCRTRLHVRDGRTDVGDRRRRAMLAGFQRGRQLGTRPTEAWFVPGSEVLQRIVHEEPFGGGRRTQGGIRDDKARRREALLLRG